MNRQEFDKHLLYESNVFTEDPTDLQLQQLNNAEMHLKHAIEKLSQTERRIKILESTEESKIQILLQLESKLNHLQNAEDVLDSKAIEKVSLENRFAQIQEELFKKEEELKEVILHLGKKVKENAMLQELLEQQKESILNEQKENEQKSEQLLRLKVEIDKISQREQLLQKQLAAIQIS